ncbi:MAG TPA: hypothetical protein VNT53_05135 [Pseudolysinimonas sp.]|nr:hypothetical protein [Pseudolysinimonas sp.]
MAIKRNRTNPVIQIDCVVSDVQRDMKKVYKDDKPTGEVTDNGRLLAVVTAPDAPDLEVKVPVDWDEFEIEPGQHLLINVEYTEWSMNSGRSGSTMRFHSLVSAGQIDAWKGVVNTQTRAAASA